MEYKKILLILVVIIILATFYVYTSESFATSPGTFVQLASSSTEYPYYGRRRVWYYPYGYINPAPYPWWRRRRVFVNEYPWYRRRWFY